MSTLSKADRKKILAMAALPRASKKSRDLLLKEVAPLVSEMTDAIQADSKPSAHMMLRAAAWEERAKRAGMKENIDFLCHAEMGRRINIAWAAERARQSNGWGELKSSVLKGRPVSMRDRNASGGIYIDWFVEDAIAPSFELPAVATMASPAALSLRGGVVDDAPEIASYWVGDEDGLNEFVQKLFNDPEVRVAYAKWKAKQP